MAAAWDEPMGDHAGLAWGRQRHLSISRLCGISPYSFQLWRMTKRKRLLKGLCEKCGYDLRASPTRCPECGHIRIYKTIKARWFKTWVPRELNYKQSDIDMPSLALILLILAAVFWITVFI